MLEQLAYYECFLCQNYFYAVDMPDGLNDPEYCPYCGQQFDGVYEVENM